MEASGGGHYKSARPSPKLAVDGVLQLLGRREADLLAGGDFDGRARGRVAAGAGRLGLDLELAEAGIETSSPFTAASGSRLEDAVDDGLGLGLGQLGVGGDSGVDQIGNVRHL
jgi:hypothetical protein